MAIHRTPIKTNDSVTSIRIDVEYCRGCDTQLIDGVQTYVCIKCTQKYHKECVDEAMADRRKMMFICNNCCNYRTRRRAQTLDERVQMTANVQSLKIMNLNNTSMIDEDKESQNELAKIDETDEKSDENVIELNETGNEIKNTQKTKNNDEEKVDLASEKEANERAQKELDDELLFIDFEQLAKRFKNVKKYGMLRMEKQMNKDRAGRVEFALERMEMMRKYYNDGTEMISYRELLMENITLQLMLMQKNDGGETVQVGECPIARTNISLTDGDDEGKNENSQAKTQRNDEANEEKDGAMVTVNKDENNDLTKTMIANGEADDTYEYEVFCRYDGYLNHKQLREIYSRFGSVKIKNVPAGKYALIKFARFGEAMMAVKEGCTKNNMSANINCNWSNYARKRMKMETTSMTNSGQKERKERELNGDNKIFKRIKNVQGYSMSVDSKRRNPFRSVTGNHNFDQHQQGYQRENVEMREESGQNESCELVVMAENTNMNASELKWTISNVFGNLLSKQNVLTTTRKGNNMVCTISNMKIEPNYLRKSLNLLVMPWKWSYQIKEGMHFDSTEGNRDFFRSHG